MSLQSLRIGSPSLLSINEEADICVPEELAELLGTSHVFIRWTEKDLDGLNGFANFYDVIDTQGLRMFRAVERTPKNLQKSKDQEHFAIAIIDSRGVEIVQYEGLIGEKYVVFQGNEAWGGVSKRIHYNNRDILPVYFIKQGTRETANLNIETTQKKLSNIEKNLNDERIEEILYIVSDPFEKNMGCCCCKVILPEERARKLNRDAERLIYLPDRRSLVGRVAKCWDTTDIIKFDPVEIKGLMGVQFPLVADIRIKAILMGVPFLLDYKLYGNVL